MYQRHIFFQGIGLFLLAFSAMNCGVGRVNGIKRLNNDQFKKQMKKEGVIVLDVRTQAEYDSIRIEGSVLVNIQDTAGFNRKVNELDPGKQYLIYCRSGRRSMTAAKALKQKGFKHVSDLQNGISGWDGPTLMGKKE